MKTYKATATFTAIVLFLLTSCSSRTNSGNDSAEGKEIINALSDSLKSIAGAYPGEIGIAVITDCGDTLTVNNENKYPLMSVFKLHQAISLCDYFHKSGKSLDSVLTISRKDLNPDTWSPMLKEHQSDTIAISVRNLLRYTLMQSDNNASNYMFEHLQSVADADSFMCTVIPRESFQLKVTEADMWSRHNRCYENSSSPLGAALLINRLFTDSIINRVHRDFICMTLKECKTGTDRIVAPLKNERGVTVGHKTGSGFRNNGVLSAHNDVAFVELPDGRHYTLAVLVKDFKGTEEDAAIVIAHISSLVYSSVKSLYSEDKKRN